MRLLSLTARFSGVRARPHDFQPFQGFFATDRVPQAILELWNAGSCQKSPLDRDGRFGHYPPYEKQPSFTRAASLNRGAKRKLSRNTMKTTKTKMKTKHLINRLMTMLPLLAVGASPAFASPNEQELGAFRVEAATDLRVVASKSGDTTVTFCQVRGHEEFWPLGDVALVGARKPGELGSSLLFAPSPRYPKALAHPEGFHCFMDSHPKDGPRVQYYELMPPEGYEGVGIVFGKDGAEPDPKDYWCVKKEYLTPAGHTTLWSDKGAGRSKNGDVWRPAMLEADLTRFKSSYPPGKVLPMLLIPPAFTASGGGADWAQKSRLKEWALIIHDDSAIRAPGFCRRIGNTRPLVQPAINHNSPAQR